MSEPTVHEGTLKLEFLYFKTIKEKSGVVYEGEKGKVERLFPWDSIPESIKPGSVPANFRQMNRRERREGGRR